MAVIINDFEIVVEPPTQTSSPAPGGSAQQQQPMQPMMLRPQDIERIVHHFEERRDRVIAD